MSPDQVDTASELASYLHALESAVAERLDAKKATRDFDRACAHYLRLRSTPDGRAGLNSLLSHPNLEVRLGCHPMSRVGSR